MRFRYFALLMLCGTMIAQTQTSWECPDSSKKGHLRIRVSDGVTNSLATQKPLPDVSDLQGRKIESLVVIEILTSTTGEVICTRPASGSPDLLEEPGGGIQVAVQTLRDPGPLLRRRDQDSISIQERQGQSSGIESLTCIPAKYKAINGPGTGHLCPSGSSSLRINKHEHGFGLKEAMGI
jgi:hypothetical protein